MSHSCPVCRHRLDLAAGVTHPGCAPGPPIGEAAESRVLTLLAGWLGAHLAQTLGAITLTEKENRP